MAMEPTFTMGNAEVSFDEFKNYTVKLVVRFSEGNTAFCLHLY